MKTQPRLFLLLLATALVVLITSCSSSGKKRSIIPGTGTATGGSTVNDPTGGFGDNASYLREVYVSLAGNDSTGNGSATNPYYTLTKAFSVSLPGDKIIMSAGIHSGGIHYVDLKGAANSPIMITGDPAGGTVIDGGTNCMQLSDAEYIVIQDIEMRNATGNGLNIDDASSFDTPTHHIVLRRLYIHDIGSDGNQDGLKLSGLDNFLIDNCEITRCGGNMSGSLIDMVGCHHGLIRGNNLHDGSGNAVQAKGATEDIYIWRNRFESAGARALNLGGSTGLIYFRPQGADYEARDLTVIANVFISCEAPICYVGCDGALVANNTFFLPTHWVIRILQETVTGFIPCRNGKFINNIIMFNEADLSTYCNVGPDTAPDTFTFSHNLWYAYDNLAFSGPTLPVTETNSLYQEDPGFVDAGSGDFHFGPGSPAAGAGKSLSDVKLDYDRVEYASPPSLGAFEMTN